MTKLGNKVKKAGIKEVVSKSPLWKGPYEDGITQSLLGRFVSCRERFKLLVIDGWSTEKGFNHRLEYGNMWHICEEHPNDWENKLKEYCQKLMAEQKIFEDKEQVEKWYRICKIQWPLYQKFYAKTKHYNSKLKPFANEFVFEQPYILPSGKCVKLRGKIDGIFLLGKKTLVQWENKTKGQVDIDRIVRQLNFDMQTMFYLVVMARRYPEYKVGKLIYNVVRRPLGGGKGTIKQKKGESKNEYYDRLEAYIREEPESYFQRLEVEVSKREIEIFEEQFLIPILEQLCGWWEAVALGKSVKIDAQYLHYRLPYDIYNPTAENKPSDFDNYMATGSTAGLSKIDTLFGELEDG